MNHSERIATRTAEIGGGLTIRRALPNVRRRTIGAWCFLDHAGPVAIAAGAGLHVGPHPHIGLQTFAWMIEGAVMHRDSLGNEQLITPGQVNLMTAGAGISHSEDSAEPGEAPRHERLHAVQLWIALPAAERHRTPAFRNHPRLPLLQLEGFSIRVLAGSAVGRTSPAQTFSPLMGVDLQARGAASLAMPLTSKFEHGVLVLSGTAVVAGEALAPGTLLYLGTGRDHLDISCDAAAHLIIIGGVPFAEEILLWWNFVARSAQEIEEATRDWIAGTRFGTVRGSPSPPLIAPDPSGLRLRSPGG
jgi:redox-sensitive bicupin YhaK (pirin superfamily)